LIELSGDRIAEAAAAEVVRRGEGRPERAVADSRELRPGDLFVGLPGERADGGTYAAQALEGGAWGVLVESRHAAGLEDGPGWVLSSEGPLRSLQALARAWRRELGCPTVGITGSTGKTSTKDICKSLLPGRVHASPENYNTEIGLSLAVLAAPPETEVLVLEMAMRGVGEIAELCEVAEPDVALITNIGPVHLELLGTIEAIVEAKAEILAGLKDGGVAVVPADADALEPHLEERVQTLTFGPGGEVFASRSAVEGEGTVAEIVTPAGRAEFRFPFTEAHNLANALAAVAVGTALELPLEEMASRGDGVSISSLRGELVRLGDGIVVINDCYNANPISMRAALDHLGSRAAAGRAVAVLGEMKELGPDAAAYHREVGAHARRTGVRLLVGVGELAAEYAPDVHVMDAAAALRTVADRLEPGDIVLVKGSRSVGLEAVSDGLLAARPDPAEVGGATGSGG
jgi:UDP-N-acetylmuramoyl-tripeptide--D-alanyl-D-alanine ligase